MLPPNFKVLNQCVGKESPLFLFHDITGQTGMLGQIASHLLIPCYGIDCNLPLYDACSDMATIGTAVAESIITAVGAVTNSAIRVGGYSFGCRLAFATAKYLEEAGYEVQLVLLDGRIDGPLRIETSVTEFACAVFAMMNQIEAEVIQGVLNDIGSKDIVQAKLGASLGDSLLDHISVVGKLAALTSGYLTEYTLRGRTLRVTSDTLLEMAEDKMLQLGNVREYKSSGGHFDFFHSDAANIAGVITKFIHDGKY